ncbi:MAG: hypothetical protein ACK5MK_06875 [Dysgonomonas sp.]
MKIQNDIRKFLLRNSIITYGCVLITGLTLFFHFKTESKAIDQARMYLYMINADGDIIPLKYADRRDNITMEVKHHLTMLVENFYSLNQNNWERKTVDKAFWLGDLEKIHKDRANKGYYNRFIQYNVIQTSAVKPENIEVRPLDSNNEFEFKIIIDMEDNYNGTISKYVIFAKGKAKVTDRNFPNNPHGIWVYEYLEEKIQKIDVD